MDGGTQTQRGRCVVGLLQHGGETHQSVAKTTAGLSSPSAQVSQPLRGLCDHVYSPLQFLLQVGDVHLVRDTILADPLHIAVLNQFIEGAAQVRIGQIGSR